MKLGKILLVIQAIVADLKSCGLLLDSGDFAPLTIGSALGVAKSVNDTLTANGVTEPAEVEKIIGALTAIGPLLA